MEGVGELMYATKGERGRWCGWERQGVLYLGISQSSVSGSLLDGMGQPAQIPHFGSPDEVRHEVLSEKCGWVGPVGLGGEGCWEDLGRRRWVGVDQRYLARKRQCTYNGPCYMESSYMGCIGRILEIRYACA